MKKYMLLGLVLVPVIAVAAVGTYRTKSGDTLQSVANKYGMSVETLATLNPGAKLVAKQDLKVAVPDPAPTTTPSRETRFKAYITAYTYWDNTPPGSADIALPVIHQKAGGTGSYGDPITLAVGHVITNGKSTPDYPKGTKFYLPYLQRYFIVEDLCGDGQTPQNGPCHTGYQGYPWLDIWIDGANGTRNATNNCTYALTDVHEVIQNPLPTYKVTTGSVYNNGCAQQYGETPVVQ